MANTFRLSILSPRGKALDADVESLVAPAEEGYLGVLAHHAPMLAALSRGVTYVTERGATHILATGSGILEVGLKGAHLFVDYAEKADTLEKARELVTANLKQTGEHAKGKTSP